MHFTTVAALGGASFNYFIQFGGLNSIVGCQDKKGQGFLSFVGVLLPFSHSIDYTKALTIPIKI